MSRFPINLCALLLLTVAAPCTASYLQFCRLEGQIVSEPGTKGDCVSFRFEVKSASEYESGIFGAGWGNCAEHVGETVEVCIAPAYQGDRPYAKGLVRILWREAMDMEVDGEMCTVISYSAIAPGAKD